MSAPLVGHLALIIAGPRLRGRCCVRGHRIVMLVALFGVSLACNLHSHDVIDTKSVHPRVATLIISS